MVYPVNPILLQPHARGAVGPLLPVCGTVPDGIVLMFIISALIAGLILGFVWGHFWGYDAGWKDSEEIEKRRDHR